MIGKLNHVAIVVPDLDRAMTTYRDALGATVSERVLGNGEPKIGAHGKPVLFLHPKDFCGTLVEIEQV